MVDDTVSAGNCPTSDVTHNGSVQYKMISATEMKVQARSGIFCGNGSDGRDSDDLVDPAKILSFTAGAVGRRTDTTTNIPLTGLTISVGRTSCGSTARTGRTSLPKLRIGGSRVGV